ncbi:MAG: amidohydrolase family protein [Planctomycetales bacterium]|nr:amidohydrolase family protein [Planctomycetales bacterium]
MSRIDSHHHFWHYSVQQYGWIQDHMAVLKRDFLPSDLVEAVSDTGITGVISVQARQTVEETEWLLSLAGGQNSIVDAVVGWVPLAAPDVQAELERLTHDSRLRAVRHVVHDEPDDDFILGTEFNRGIETLKRYNLVYDILIFGKHLRQTIKFVDQHPEQPFVLDHIAKPTIRAGKFDEEWAKLFKELAKRPHVSCKFSGVVTEVRDPSWTIDLLRPYWDTAWQAFGDGRLMYGSDWPVCLLRSEYQQWIQTVEALSGGLSPTELQSFWSGAATKAYNLVSRG